MDNASMFMMIDVISLGCGAYCVYTWLRLLREKKLFKNVTGKTPTQILR